VRREVGARALRVTDHEAEALPHAQGVADDELRRAVDRHPPDEVLRRAGVGACRRRRLARRARGPSGGGGGGGGRSRSGGRGRRRRRGV
jgi:hypothetical protein